MCLSEYEHCVEAGITSKYLLRNLWNVTWELPLSLQVDFLNLTDIAPQEAVARIKDKPIVTLTILRGVSSSKQKSSTQDHIYDEIMYADQQLSQNLSQQEDFSQFMTAGLSQESFPSRHRQRLGQLSERDLLRHEIKKRGHDHAPNGVKETRHINYPTVSSNGTQVTLPGEKGSKDSGLSSGSSTSPEHHKDRARMVEGQAVVYPEDAPFDRIAKIRHSYRTEREMLKKFLKSQKKEPDIVVETGTVENSRRNCRIEGDYEVEVGVRMFRNILCGCEIETWRVLNQTNWWFGLQHVIVIYIKSPLLF